MNFLQMHERLRLELLRRIQRGTLSVSLLARQTGFGQSHLSNFLRSRRQLSLEALDRVLASQLITAGDLLPVSYTRAEPTALGENGPVPVVSHATAMFEPYIRPSSVHRMLPLPGGVLRPPRMRPARSRQPWQRYVAVSIPAPEALPMDPVVLPEALVLLDRHDQSLVQYRPSRPNLYAVRNGNRLVLRYVDFVLNRLVLRPHNLAFPVDLLEIPPGETTGDLITGRVVLVVNQL